MGSQVWPGALLMVDYMSTVNCTDVVELGCGVGLTAIALALRGVRVIATGLHITDYRYIRDRSRRVSVGHGEGECGEQQGGNDWEGGVATC